MFSRIPIALLILRDLVHKAKHQKRTQKKQQQQKNPKKQKKNKENKRIIIHTQY